MPVVHPVRPIQVGVASKHLLVHVLDLHLESVAEAGCLAKPVVRIGASMCWCWQWRGLLERLRRKGGFILNLASDPRLDVLHVGGGWEIDRVAAGINPRVGSAKVKSVIGAHLSLSGYVRASGHCWAGLVVAQTDALATVLGLHNLDHACQKAVLLDNCIQCQSDS